MFGAICWETEEEPFDNSERRKFQDKLMTIRNRRHREEYQKELNELDFRKYIARKEFRFNMKGRWNFVSALILIAFTAIIIITLIPPFILYGQGIVPEFCRNNSKLAVVSRKWTTMMKIADEVRPGDLDKLEWCKKPYSYGLWPTFYSNIQHKYWDVGLFRYWQIRKIPCFLLATPALILTAIAIRITYRDIFEERKWFNIWVLFGRSDHLVPYAIHAAFLMFLGCFVINAEVFTRIIFSSTPFLYVFLAEWIDELTKGNTFANTMLDYEEANPFIPFFFIKRVWDSGIWAKLFYLYFVSYFVFGTIAHAAWLPFT
ncbi:unnamed protein product [Caenorhabditis angaria]|uniref:GPI mannosyltransferase 2 n=1 Tax=Caenorhabditis angaria TaxID=860376 RepID=A0A9P1I6I5_9PELO|nr:unnamed protein product [Caenorhabditis angaria]